MPSKFTPRWKWEKVDPNRCPASVHEGGRAVGFHQCLRKRGKGKDGWCAIHDPKAEEKRREDQDRRWDEKMKRDREWRIESALRDATVDQLKAELARRKKPKK